MNNYLSLFPLFASPLLQAALCIPLNTTKPTVTLASGVVIGTTTLLPAATAPVHKYLGIPFAASPPERFSAPTDPAAWHTPLQAFSYQASCIQQFNGPAAVRNFTINVFNNPTGPPLEESEDCLYLNVFTPSSPPPTAGRAVMFWLYGGGLQFGSGGLTYYDGTSFATSQDVIMVTTNYRTNIFGFSNSPETLSSDQNAGLLDQRKALSWVSQNIGAFGGDPCKITIFGESAGGWSVKQLLAFPPAPLPFQAAIMESEAEFLSGNSTANWLTVVEHFNCTTAKSPTQCMRSVNALDIKRFIETEVLNFSPVYNNVTATTDVRPFILSKEFAQVPILLGTNAQEGRSIAPQTELAVPNLTDKEYLNLIYPNRSALQSSILRAYPPYEASQPYGLPALVLTDGFFMCPASILANTANANGHNIWRYYYNASFSNTQSFPDAGVYHYSEIPEIWGTYPRANATLEETQLSNYMQKTWANFAKDPVKGPGWARLGTNGGKELGVIGGHNRTIKTVPLNTTDFICNVYAGYLDEIGV